MILVLALLATFLADAAPATEAHASPAIDKLSWMAGHWTSTDPDGSTSEEGWFAPRNGLMVGVNRGTYPNGKASFEFLRIEERGGEVYYLASPGGAEPTVFRMTSSKPTSATFENPKHDFPKRITYRAEGDSLIARIDGGADAPPDQSMEFRWARKKK